MKLELAKGGLRVMSQNPDLGEAKEDVPVEYDGEGLKIGFNARYLMDVVQVIRSSDVQLELADDLTDDEDRLGLEGVELAEDVGPARGRDRSFRGGGAHVWIPHSVLESPAQRPDRGSSPGATRRVHGSHPIDG